MLAVLQDVGIYAGFALMGAMIANPHFFLLSKEDEPDAND